MKLDHAVTLYVQLIQANGCHGASIASVLRMFVKSMGANRDLNSILPEEVRAFLDGDRPLGHGQHYLMTVAPPARDADPPHDFVRSIDRVTSR